MHFRNPTTWLLLCAALVAGCGQNAASRVTTTPKAQRTVERAGGIVLRGDYAPDQHGPIALDGRYTVRFTQEGAGTNFATEVPFTAHREKPTTGRAAPTFPLFKHAAKTGATTVTV